jgi:hypothetical protein
MKKGTVWGFFLVWLVFSCSAVVTPEHDFTGTWVGETEIPNETELDQLTLILAKKDGKWMGTLTDSMEVATDGKCKNLKISDDVMTFDFDVTDGYDVFPVNVKLKISGDTMTGAWSTPDGYSADINLKRKK